MKQQIDHTTLFKEFVYAIDEFSKEWITCGLIDWLLPLWHTLRSIFLVPIISCCYYGAISLKIAQLLEWVNVHMYDL